MLRSSHSSRIPQSNMFWICLDISSDPGPVCWSLRASSNSCGLACLRRGFHSGMSLFCTEFLLVSEKLPLTAVGPAVCSYCQICCLIWNWDCCGTVTWLFNTEIYFMSQQFNTSGDIWNLKLKSPSDLDAEIAVLLGPSLEMYSFTNQNKIKYICRGIYTMGCKCILC